MIQKINGLRTQTTNQTKLLQNKQNPIQRVSLTSEPDTFERTTPSFTGKEKNVGELATELISRRKSAEGKLSKYMGDYLPKDKDNRILLAMVTGGISEGVAYIRAKMDISKDKREIYEQFASAGSGASGYTDGLINKSENSAEQIKLNLEKELLNFSQMEDVRENQIEKFLLQPLRYNATPPNSLMYISKNDKVSEELIAWTKLRADANIVTIGENDDILANMEKAEEHYQTTGERTLLHIRDFDKLLDPDYYLNKIGGMKSLLGKCATKYHTTVLFSTKDPDKLDSIATADHRVTRIDIPAEKSIGEIWGEIAKQQIESGEKLSDYEKVRNALYITGYYRDGLAVTPESSPEEIQEVWNQIDTKLIGDILTSMAKGKIYDKTPTPGFAYVKNEDGSIEKIPVYNYKFSKYQEGTPGVMLRKSSGSVFSPQETPNEASELVALSSLVPPTLNNRMDPFGLHTYNIHTIAYPTKDGKFPEKTRECDLNCNDYIFERAMKDYKSTGNKILDEYFTNKYTSPMSSRGWIEYIPLPEKNATSSIDSYPLKNMDIYKDLLCDYGSYRIPSMKPNSMLLPAGWMPFKNETLGMVLKLRGISSSKEIPSDEKIAEINKLRQSVIFSDKELSESEIAKKFILERLKDKERNFNDPIAALNDLYLFKGFAKSPIFDKNSTELEISRGIRRVRDSILEQTKDDMRKFNYRDFYPMGDYSIVPDLRSTHGLPALIAVADEHLAKEDGVPKISIRSTFYYPSTYYSVGISGMYAILDFLEHRDEIVTCSEALDAILRVPTWYYDIDCRDN